MMSKDISHFVLAPLPAWGHVRPLTQLALRLVDFNEKIVVTIFIGPNLLAKTRAEISANTTIPLEHNSRIRILTTIDSTEQDVFKLLGPLVGSYPEAYKTLHEAKAITCATTGVTYSAVKAPVAVLLDFFLGPTVFATRAMAGQSVRIFTWATGAPAASTRLWGPEHLGGLGDFEAKVEEEARQTGAVAADIGDIIYRRTSGAIVELPGLPTVYDHELFPQELAAPPSVYQLVVSGHAVFKNCDGIVVSSSYALEGKAVEGMKKWWAENGKEVYGVGPLLPRTYWDTLPTDEGAIDVRDFLEGMLAKHGKRSVILVSFGSFFWPPVQEYVEELIMGLIDKKFPFIFCHASPFAVIPPELSNVIKSSGLGILSSWVPQQYVLNHPATGWFLTHGGQGSVTESLGSGIPLICWPIEADQPIASLQAVHSLRVAFELVEVRNGQGLGPIHRLGGHKPEGTRAAVGREIREVIDASRGEVGQEMRKRAESIKAEMQKSWDEGGVAAKELAAFLEKLVL